MINDNERMLVIARIKARLAEPGMASPVNANVREGYEKALEVLEKRIIDIKSAGLESLASVQGRSIAVLAMDYLKGECNERFFTGILLSPDCEKGGYGE